MDIATRGLLVGRFLSSFGVSFIRGVTVAAYFRPDKTSNSLEFA